MAGGLIALVVVLAAASAAGFAVRHRQGRFRAPRAAGPGHPAGSAGLPQSAEPVLKAADLPPDSAASSRGVLSSADLGASLGAQATLVQFSTEVCAYCGPTRELLTEVARERDGVAFVEIDAARRMDLTRRLRVLATPTVLVLDAAGGIASRASGPVRKADLAQVLGKILTKGGLPS